MPQVESVASCGGSTYQVPVEVPAGVVRRLQCALILLLASGAAAPCVTSANELIGPLTVEATQSEEGRYSPDG